jgi:hypothetical protein
MMTGLALERILLDGFLLSLGASIVIIGSLVVNPRIWLKDAPQVVKDKVPPLSADERRQANIAALLAMVLLFGILAYATANVMGAGASLVGVFVHIYLVFAIFNLVDLVLIDYLLIMVLKPSFILVPGVTMDELQQPFSYHFNGFLKGLVIGGVVSALVTAVAGLISLL